MDAENKEVIATGEPDNVEWRGLLDDVSRFCPSNTAHRLDKDPGEKKDINSSGTAGPAAEDAIPPENGEDQEEKEMSNDELRRKISFVLRRYDPIEGDKNEYEVFMPDGNSKKIMLNDTTTVWDLTDRMDKWIGPRMLFMGLRSRKARKNARGEYEWTDRTITRESTMPWTLKEIHEEHKWVLVVCFRSEKEGRDVTEPWAGLLNRPSGAGRG